MHLHHVALKNDTVSTVKEITTELRLTRQDSFNHCYQLFVGPSSIICTSQKSGKLENHMEFRHMLSLPTRLVCAINRCEVFPFKNMTRMEIPTVVDVAELCCKLCLFKKLDKYFIKLFLFQSGKYHCISCFHAL